MTPRNLAWALDPSLMMVAAGFSPDRWQRAVLRSSVRRQLLLCSRQVGKSTSTAVMALHEAMFVPSAVVLLLSPSFRQSQELFRKLKTVWSCLQAPKPAATVGAMTMHISSGGSIYSLPGKEETIRGFSGVTLLIIDEAARVPDPLYYAVRPMLAVSKGRLVCLSTPFGRRGFFFDEWHSSSSWRRTLIKATECPRISRQFLAEEKTSLGAYWFRQEYLCEFVENDTQLFSDALVQSSLTPDIKPLFEETPRASRPLHPPSAQPTNYLRQP